MAKLIFQYGVMKSGKSMEIAKTYTNYIVKGEKPLVLKPSIDTRDENIKSRLGIEIPCKTVSPDEDLTKLIFKDSHSQILPPVILIDEAQFLTSTQVTELTVIVDKGEIDVVCFGLKNDFRGLLFEGSKSLIEEADKLVEIKTLCFFCHKKATHTLLTEIKDGKRYAADTTRENNVIIGDEDFFPTCRDHYHDYTSRTKEIKIENKK